VSPWRTVALGDIAESVDYGVTASAKQQPPGPKFLRITDIQNGIVRWAHVPWCDCDAQAAADARLRAGDIVFARTGATTGKSCLIRECPADAVFASYLIRVRLPATVEPRFVSHYFQTPDYWAQVTRGARGVAQPGVNATTLKSLTVPLPPLPEQRRIAAILDKADALRAKRRAALEQLNALTQAVFLEMFGNPATNPRGWPQRSLSDVVDGPYGVKAGPFGSSLKKEEYTESGYRVYGQEQVLSGRFDIGDYHISERKYHALKSCAVKEGDVLVSLVGSFGKVLVVPAGIEPGIINPRLLKITPRRDLLTPEFLASLLQQPSIQSEFERLSHGGTMGILNAGLVKRLKVLLVPLRLQDAFIQAKDRVEGVRSRQEKSVQVFESLFSTLQHQAFSGAL